MANNTALGKNLVPMANKYDRVVILVDMDCFYCQVEENLDPSLKHQPMAVVQYNAWRGGSIIAVNYAARAKGVTRHMRGDEAKEQCPEIQLVKVPNVRNKADLTKYREAGKEIANILQRFTPLLERASVDEAYLDITDAVDNRLQEINNGTFILQPRELANTFAVGYPSIGEFVITITSSFITNPMAADDNLNRNFNGNGVLVRQSNVRLLIGASIANEVRSAVKAETSYECSAGIAHNKILAKLACGMNKPNKQTILPLAQIPDLFETLPVGKIKGLGSKFGEEVCERLNVCYLGQLLKFTEAELRRKFDEKNGTWLYNICRGIDLEAVTHRFYSKSIGCCKKFPGRNNITGLKTLQHWLYELGSEINERLEEDICENNRRAKQMVTSFIQELDGEEVSSSRSSPLQCYDTEVLAKTSLEIIRANTKQFFRPGSESVLNNPIKFLGISVGKFETISNSQNNIKEMFAQQTAKKQKLKNDLKNEAQTNLNASEYKPEKNNNIEINSKSLKQIPMEYNVQNVRSFLLRPTTPDKNETNLVPETDNKMENNLLKQKEKSFQKSKSFFFNSLKEQINKSQVNENNKTELNSIPQNKLVRSSEGTCSDNTNKVTQNIYLPKALQNEDEEIKKIVDEGLPFDNINLNIKQDSKASYCNEANEIKSVQNEENLCNSDLRNETNSFISNTINSGIDICLEISDNDPVVNNDTINKKRKYEKISDTEEHNKTNYRLQYAEFAIPELNTAFLQFTKCSKCGLKILNDPISMQTHEDHHFAQELSKKQRNEYRDKIRTKIISSKCLPDYYISNKKPKNVNNVFKKTSSDIKKFLKPFSSPTLPSILTSSANQWPEISTSNIEICDICKLPIKIEEILEHKDFHMAKNVQRKLNQLQVRTVEVVKKSASDSPSKSMNSSINTSTRQSKVTTKPITEFFTQSNV